jgi:hypothetical protein
MSFPPRASAGAVLDRRPRPGWSPEADNGVLQMAGPFPVEVELLPDLFDDAFADIAERSDGIGEDAAVGGHGKPFLSLCLKSGLPRGDNPPAPG